MTDSEVIMHEALEILGGADDGLTAREIFDASRIAMGLPEVTGALNRLRGQKKVCRGTDKRWRTISQAERSEAQRAERVKAAAQAVAAERAKPDPVKEAKVAGDGSKFSLTREQTDKINAVAKAIRDRDQKARQREMSPAVARVAKRDQERRQAEHRTIANQQWLIGELEVAVEASQVRLDRYVNQLGDEILEHLVEMTLAANRALEAARSRA